MKTQEGDAESEPTPEAALLKELLEEDSDSAPEEVTFAEGQKDTLECLKTIQTQVRKSQAKLKEERRKIQERYISQKTRKQQSLEALESKKLPDEILHQVASRDFPEKRCSKDVSSRLQGRKRKSDATVSDSNETEEKNRRQQDSEEFISLCGSTEFHVSVLDKEVEKAKSLSEKALEFREKHLFGDKIKRQPSQAYLGMMKKRVIAGHIKPRQ